MKLKKKETASGKAQAAINVFLKLDPVMKKCNKHSAINTGSKTMKHSNGLFWQMEDGQQITVDSMENLNIEEGHSMG